jgi:hypothetical protein
MHLLHPEEIVVVVGSRAGVAAGNSRSNPGSIVAGGALVASRSRNHSSSSSIRNVAGIAVALLAAAVLLAHYCTRGGAPHDAAAGVVVAAAAGAHREVHVHAAGAVSLVSRSRELPLLLLLLLVVQGEQRPVVLLGRRHGGLRSGSSPGEHHRGSAPRLQRVQRELGGAPAGSAPDGEVAAEDALHVVAAHVEVGNGVEPAELDRSDVVRLRRLFLSTCSSGVSAMPWHLSG